MSVATGDRVRLVGLSTSIANADDVADWMQIDRRALYNFHPAVRPTRMVAERDRRTCPPLSRRLCVRRSSVNPHLRVSGLASLLPAHADVEQARLCCKLVRGGGGAAGVPPVSLTAFALRSRSWRTRPRSPSSCSSRRGGRRV